MAAVRPLLLLKSMLLTIFLVCFAGGAVARLVHEVHHAPEGYEGPGGLTIVEKPAARQRPAWVSRVSFRFPGVSGGKRALAGRAG
jgi:hypothetical protein